MGSYLDPACLDPAINSVVLKSRQTGPQCDRDSVAGSQPLCKPMFLVKGYLTVDRMISARSVFFGEQKYHETVSLRVSGFALAAPIVLCQRENVLSTDCFIHCQGFACVCVHAWVKGGGYMV